MLSSERVGIEVEREPRGFMLAHLVARCDREAESLESGFACNGVEAKATDHRDSASEWNESHEASHLLSHRHLR